MSIELTATLMVIGIGLVFLTMLAAMGIGWRFGQTAAGVDALFKRLDSDQMRCREIHAAVDRAIFELHEKAVAAKAQADAAMNEKRKDDAGT